MDQASDLTVFITRHGDELITVSRAVAIAFGKRHKKVLRAIEATLLSRHAEIAEHGPLNFEPSSYANTQGKTRPMYRMTAKGMSEREIGFTESTKVDARRTTRRTARQPPRDLLEGDCGQSLRECVVLSNDLQFPCGRSNLKPVPGPRHEFS
jgi:Rha family phage regulatory protein